MMKPMTDEQRKLAEENHDLVYAFLEENHLSVNQYYDVVIFGYLCSVQEYCENSHLKKYHLATLAWKKMKRELIRYYKYLGSDKRSYSTVSFQDHISDNSSLCWEDVICDKTDVLEQLQTELILHDLAVKLPKKEMRIIRRKLYGEKMHDIAKAEKMTFSDINQLLNSSRNTIVEIILG